MTARMTISDIAVARSTRNGANKGGRVALFMVFARFSAWGSSFASAFFIWCRSPIIAFLRVFVINLVARGCPGA